MGEYDTQECIVCELGIFTITAELYYSQIIQQWQPRVHLITNAEDRALSPQMAADLGTCLIRAAERIHENELNKTAVTGQTLNATELSFMALELTNWVVELYSENGKLIAENEALKKAAKQHQEWW